MCMYMHSICICTNLSRVIRSHFGPSFFFQDRQSPKRSTIAVSLLIMSDSEPPTPPWRKRLELDKFPKESPTPPAPPLHLIKGIEPRTSHLSDNKIPGQPTLHSFSAPLPPLLLPPVLVVPPVPPSIPFSLYDPHSPSSTFHPCSHPPLSHPAFPSIFSFTVFLLEGLASFY